MVLGELLITKLQKRAASALVLIPVTLAVLFYGGVFFTVALAFLMFLSLYEWIQLSWKTQVHRRALFSLFGVVYVLVSFWCCYLIRMDYAVIFSFLFVCMIWASDIGAYVVGKTMRGPKMASQISPNKTWAGYAGALFFPGLISVVFMNLYHLFFAGGAALDISADLVLFGAGVVIGVVGQSGDLVVSFLKRQAHVKDTGSIIPGHGGLLDRIDSLLLTAPVFLFFVSNIFNV